MKKTMRYLSMAALALVGAVMTGCSSDDNIIDNPQQPENKDKTETLTTTVGFGEAATTRALTSGGVKTFAAGETMAVVYKNKSGQTVKAVSEPLTAGDIASGNKSASFTFTLDDPDKTKGVMYIYPAAMAKASIATDATIDEANTVDYSKLNDQDGSLATLASNLDLATYSGAWVNGSSLPASTLVNQLAVCALTFKDCNGNSTITSGLSQVTVSDGSNTYTVTPTNGTFGENTIYVAIRPVTAALEYEADYYRNNYTKTATSRTYAAGNFYNLGLRVSDVIWDFSQLSGDYNLNDVEGYEYGGVRLTGDGTLDFKNRCINIGGVLTFTAPDDKLFQKIVISTESDDPIDDVNWQKDSEYLQYTTYTWTAIDNWTGNESGASVNIYNSNYITEIKSIVFTLN